MIMPIGRYKGQAIEDIYDESYLRWFVFTVTGYTDIKAAIHDHLENSEWGHEYDDADFGHPGNPSWYGYN